MFYALSWFLVVALVALWSLVAWVVHAAAVWTISNAGAFTEAASGAVSLTLPDWLAPWVPPEVAQWATRLMADFAPFIDGLLQATPALAGGLTIAAWVIWGIGSVLLVLLGAGAHLVIALWRRRGGSSPIPTAAHS